MKRSPLTRKTPMSRGSSPMKRSKMKRRKPRGQPPERRDDAFKAFVRTLPCCAPIETRVTRDGDALRFRTIRCGRKPCDPNHAHGEGMAVKTHDRTCVPLCREPAAGIDHHGDYEQKSGPFKGFTKQQTRDWHDAESKRVNELYERSRA